MKTIITALAFLLLIPAAISCADFRPDPVRAFIDSQPSIAIDTTLIPIRADKSPNQWLKPKGW